MDRENYAVSLRFGDSFSVHKTALTLKVLVLLLSVVFALEYFGLYDCLYVLKIA